VQQRGARERPSGTLNPDNFAAALRLTIPENSIVVDESVTTGRESFDVTAGAAPHDNLQNMGGSIGFGTPVATGAAIACPDRPVLAIVGDGSAMYTLQSLWTQAREGLKVTTVICANRTYQILKNEFKAVGAGVPGPSALSMLDIDKPTLDFVALAKGMGVAGARVATAEDLCREIERGFTSHGPYLIEAQL
jgi:acetolactate synthase I/II/III large subunit